MVHAGDLPKKFSRCPILKCDTCMYEKYTKILRIVKVDIIEHRSAL
jgi:hypothetical protein